MFISRLMITVLQNAPFTILTIQNTQRKLLLVHCFAERSASGRESSTQNTLMKPWRRYGFRGAVWQSVCPLLFKGLHTQDATCFVRCAAKRTASGRDISAQTMPMKPGRLLARQMCCSAMMRRLMRLRSMPSRNASICSLGPTIGFSLHSLKPAARASSMGAAHGSRSQRSYTLQVSAHEGAHHAQ